VAMVGGPLFLGRNVAIMTGMNAGLAILIKRLRGDVEDWKNGCVTPHPAIAIAYDTSACTRHDLDSLHTHSTHSAACCCVLLEPQTLSARVLTFAGRRRRSPRVRATRWWRTCSLPRCCRWVRWCRWAPLPSWGMP
jgi:hypothetical protein